MKRFFQTQLTKILLNQGYSDHYAKIISKDFINDLLQKDLPLKSKLWAKKRGFFSKKLNYFKLTDENYTDYISDFDYYRLHPINGIFSRWIDDKLSIRLILHPFTEYLPGYYFHLLDGEILLLPDCHKQLSNTIDDIIQLLIHKKDLAAKPYVGSKGQGFTKLSYKNSKFYLNDQQSSRNELEKRFQDWKAMRFGGYLITEYLKPCKELSDIWAKTANTVRISIIRKKHHKPEIVAAYIRFGTEKSGIVDNACSGGVACRIDLSNGSFSEGVKFLDGKIVKYKHHPDTQLSLQGVIPHWFEIKEKIIEISSYIPQVIYFGYDIAVTEGGFKILEINSHEGIAFNQFYTPYLSNEQTKDFFVPLLDNKKQELEARKSHRFIRRIVFLLKKIKHKIAQALRF